MPALHNYLHSQKTENYVLKFPEDEGEKSSGARCEQAKSVACMVARLKR